MHTHIHTHTHIQEWRFYCLPSGPLDAAFDARNSTQTQHSATIHLCFYFPKAHFTTCTHIHNHTYTATYTQPHIHNHTHTHTHTQTKTHTPTTHNNTHTPHN